MVQIGGGGPPARLLVVEDDPDTATTSKLLLELVGYQVDTASDGPSALALLRNTEIDVVLCDLALRGPMTGLELAAAMKNDPDLKKIPLVAVTGFGQQDDRDRTAAAGFIAHLIKPVELPVLQEVLRSIGARKRPPNAPNRARSIRRRAPTSKA